MNTYIFDGIKIETTAEVISVKYIPPKRGLIQEYWRNSYFKRHTASYLTVKAAEVVCRSFSLHALYLLVREHQEIIFLYAPILFHYLQSIQFSGFLSFVSVGYVCGILTTFILKRLRAFVSDFKGECKHE